MVAINAAWELIGEPARRVGLRPGPGRRGAPRRRPPFHRPPPRHPRPRRPSSAARHSPSRPAARRRHQAPDPLPPPESVSRDWTSGRSYTGGGYDAETMRAPEGLGRRRAAARQAVRDRPRVRAVRRLVARRDRPNGPRLPRVARPDGDRSGVSGRDRRDPAAGRASEELRRGGRRAARALQAALSPRRRIGRADRRPPRHHSARVCRMLMLWRMPRPTAMLISDAPPWEMNGSGMPGDRHDPDDHPEVDDQLEQEHRGEARREHRPERVLRPPAADEDPPEQRREQHEQEDRPEEPQLLEIDRRDEVALLDRQEIQLVLRPVRQALAEQAAGPDRDLGLVELPAGALDVAGPGRGTRGSAAAGSRAARCSRRTAARPGPRWRSRRASAGSPRT